jgi:hypothetical protein
MAELANHMTSGNKIDTDLVSRLLDQTKRVNERIETHEQMEDDDTANL